MRIGRAGKLKLLKMTAVLLIFTFCLSLFALKAYGSSSVTLAAPEVQGWSGGTVHVPVNLTSTGQVGGVQFNLNYDSALLTLDDAFPGLLTPGFVVEKEPIAGGVKILIFANPTEPIAAGTGSVAVLAFQVNGDAVPGESCPLTLENIVLADTTSPVPNPITPFNQFDGSFTVIAEPPLLPELSVPHVQGWPGGFVHVPVNLSSEGQVAGVQFVLNYAGVCGSKVLTFEGIAPGKLTQGFSVNAELRPDGNSVIVQVFANPTTSIPAGKGSVAVLTFKAVETLLPGDCCDLQLKNVVLADTASPIPGPILPVALINGLFEVPQFPTLWVPHLQGAPGEIVEVPVNLKSGGHVAGLQFSLGYDESSLTYLNKAVGILTFNWDINNFHAGYGLNKLNMQIFHVPTKNIPASDDSVVKLLFEIADDAPAGASYPLLLSGVVMADSFSPIPNSIPNTLGHGSLTVVPGTFTLTVSHSHVDAGITVPGAGDHVYDPGDPVTLSAEPNPGWRFVKWIVNGAEHTQASLNIVMDDNKQAMAHFDTRLKGDVNGDGIIDIIDVVMAVNIALEKHDPSPAEFWAADINDDNEIDILDIVAIVNLALAF